MALFLTIYTVLHPAAGHQYKKNFDYLEEVQQRVTKMIHQDEALRRSWGSWVDLTFLVVWQQPDSAYRLFTEKTGPCSSQLCVMGGQEKETFRLYFHQHSSSGRYYSERICSLHPWRFSRPDWIKPWCKIIWTFKLALFWAEGWTRGVLRFLCIWIIMRASDYSQTWRCWMLVSL